MKKITHKSDAVLQGLMDYLLETGEEKLLPEVSRQLDNVVSKSKKTDEIIVTSVVPLTQLQKENIKKILSKYLNISFPLENKLDKKLIGGFTIRVNDWFLDASLSHQLEFIRKILLT